MNETQNSKTGVVSVVDWVLTIFVASIPLVNIVMLVVWGFGEGTNKNKANWAKATLIWIAISAGLVIVFGIMFGLFAYLARVVQQ